jgi:hypothetical protein
MRRTSRLSYMTFNCILTIQVSCLKLRLDRARMIFTAHTKVMACPGWSMSIMEILWYEVLEVDAEDLGLGLRLGGGFRLE